MAAAWFRRHRLPDRLRAMLSKGAGSVTVDVRPPTLRAALRRGLRDLLRPLFWAPVILVGAVILLSGSSWGDVMWIAVRAVTVGWVLFSVARLFDPKKLLLWLRRKGHWGPAMALSRALRPKPEESGDPHE